MGKQEDLNFSERVKEFFHRVREFFHVENYYTDLEYLGISKWKRFLYKIKRFFMAVPKKIAGFFKAIGMFFAKLAIGIVTFFAGLGKTFAEGSISTKLSYVFMGAGNFANKQFLRGIMFQLFELVFIFYMYVRGGYWLSMMPSLGKRGPEEVYNEIKDTYTTIKYDNSFRILLYSVLTIFFICAFLYTWYANIRQCRALEQIRKSGKKVKSGKDDLRSLVDDQFHKTLLALPMTGIVVFTVMPIVFMTLVAFTSYDGSHDGYNNALFGWVGLKNFANMLGGQSGYTRTFLEILTWTLIWAFFATFTNYFLGMFVAMMINKKGIRLKKVWRTILVLTIAIPQFISLLYVSKMFTEDGIVNGMLKTVFQLSKALPFFTNGTWARVMVIVINIWIGIPYLMLIATGILMNIPQDLYEASRVDGASGWQQYSKITLPYMLFITGPYLLTSFTSNMNNFNVIYLLTGGLPTNPNLYSGTTSVGYPDLLVTWLFKLTTGDEKAYYMASVVGVLIFVVVALITLLIYGLLPSVKNEEDFQ